MKQLSLIILLLNTLGAFSEISHDTGFVLGCFFNGSTQIHLEFDGEEVFYFDFQKEKVVYNWPAFVSIDPSLFNDSRLIRKALSHRRACYTIVAFLMKEENYPPEEQDAPESTIYPSEEIQVGVANSLICFVNHFYPPSIEVIWTKNGHVLSDGVSLSRYYPNNDKTFHMFSTLTFTPREGDIYSCIVEHSALQQPLMRFWEPNVIHHPGLEVFCGLGLTLGFLGVTTGTFLIVKGHHAIRHH